MSIAIGKIENKTLDYIRRHYTNESTKSISKKVGIPEVHVRNIAMQLGVTKRLSSDLIYLKDSIWRDIIYPGMGFSRYEISEYGHVRRKDDHIAIVWTYTHDDYW